MNCGPVSQSIFDGYAAKTYTNPALAAGAQLSPIFFRQLFPLTAAGTYSVINLDKGQVILLDVQTTVTINNAAGTLIGVYYTGDFVELTATSDSGSFVARRLAADVPNQKFTTSAAASGLTLTGAVLVGARTVYWQNTTDGAMAVQLPDASDVIAALAAAGLPRIYNWIIVIANRGDNTVTLTAGADATITGEATLATLVTRTYLVSTDSAGLMAIRSVSKGTIET